LLLFQVDIDIKQIKKIPFSIIGNPMFNQRYLLAS